MKLYLCPANQVFKDMALSAMDYYYETNIISIAGTGQSAFGDNYFDIPTTQIDVVIDDDEYAQIVASDRDHTLGRWWSIGAIITDDNDVRIFIGLIRNDTIKHNPALNTFGFEVLDLLGCLITEYEKGDTYIPTYERYAVYDDNTSEPLTMLTPNAGTSIQTSLDNNIDEMVISLEETIGIDSLSGIALQVSLPTNNNPIYFTKSGNLFDFEDKTSFDFPYYGANTPFDQWSDKLITHGLTLKCVERFMDEATVKYRMADGTYSTSESLPTAIEIRIYRLDSRSGYATIYVSQFHPYSPLSVLGSARMIFRYLGGSYESAMNDLALRIKYRIGGISAKVDTILANIGNNDNLVMGGRESIAHESILLSIGYIQEADLIKYTIARDYFSPVDYPNVYIATCSTAITSKPIITLSGKSDPITYIVESGNYNDASSNIKDILALGNATMQAKNNILAVNAKLSLSNLEISTDEEVTVIDDDMLSAVSINGSMANFNGITINGDVLFCNPVLTSDKTTVGVIQSTLDTAYRSIFNAYNVLMLADLIGYYEFTPGQAISYNGKYYRVFAWEYDEENGVTSIDAYGRK